jgi:broad specificity phosphatase PhoE
MRIILARHGQTTANAEKRFQGHIDFPLNELGLQQAENLAAQLRQYNPGRIFTSDLCRSILTAAPAARLLRIDPIPSPIYREYSWGELEGLSWPEIKERYPALFSRLRRDLRGADIPGQEPLDEFRRRLQKGLSMLLDPGGPRTVALIGHGRYLNAMVVEYLGLDFDGPWPFSFASAAVTILEEVAGRRRILKFNEECHLTGEVNV